MKINRDNYEQYFIDHFDGRLNASLEKELRLFLQDNPDLKEEFESFELINVNLGDTVQFTEKQKLKKTEIRPTRNINEHNYDEYFISATEGELTPSEQIELNKFIRQNPHLQKQLDLYGLTRLSPDPAIVFPDKSSLKKHAVPFIKTWYKTIGIAATLLLLIGLFNILQPTKPKAPIKNNNDELLINIKGKNFQSFQLSTISINYPALIPKNYQPIQRNPEEINSEEPMIKISSSRISVSSYLASLPKPSPTPGLLQPKYEYDYLAREIMINEELLLASFGETNPNEREKLEKAFWAKLFGNHQKRKDYGEKMGEEIPKAKINLWTIASMGIEGFNAITGSNLNIERKPNKEGEKNKFILVNANANAETTDNPH